MLIFSFTDCLAFKVMVIRSNFYDFQGAPVAQPAERLKAPSHFNTLTLNMFIPKFLCPRT